MDDVIADIRTENLPIREKATDDQYIKEMIAEIVSGKKERFEEIVYMFGPQIYSFAFRLTQNWDDSLDVLQEVFLRLYKALPVWKGRAKFSTWLYRIVYNTTMDYIRIQNKYRLRKITPFEPESNGHHNDISEGVEHRNPFYELERKESRLAIYRALLKLSFRQRRCFVLRHFCGLSINDTAKVMELAPGTIKRHLHRATQRMRAFLKEIKP